MDRDPNMYNYNTGGGNLSITPGTDVFDVNGDKIGSVLQSNPQMDYLVVEKGILFKKDLYIPTSAVSGSSPNGISLNLSKDDLKDDRFTAPMNSDANSDIDARQRDMDNDMLP